MLSYSLGARVSLELATRGPIHSVIAIAPDGLGLLLEQVYQATALMACRTMATLLAPIATLVAASGTGRSPFFDMERSRPWKLSRPDARQRLLNFANASAYEEAVLAGMFDVPGRHGRRRPAGALVVLAVPGTAAALQLGTM